MKPPKSILRKGSDMPKPIQRVKLKKAIARHTKIRDQNSALGYICPSEPHQRSTNAPQFEGRYQEETVARARCTRGSVEAGRWRRLWKIDSEIGWRVVYRSAEGCIGQIPWCIIPEVSARGESQSNGCCEQADQVVAESIRVLKEQAEQKAKVKLNVENNICHWMVRWAATLCSKHMVGKHFTSAGGERNATWLLCHLEKVYCTTDQVRDRGQRWHLVGTLSGNQRGAHRNSHMVWSGLTLSAGEMTPHDGARL